MSPLRCPRTSAKVSPSHFMSVAIGIALLLSGPIGCGGGETDPHARAGTSHSASPLTKPSPQASRFGESAAEKPVSPPVIAVWVTDSQTDREAEKMKAESSNFSASAFSFPLSPATIEQTILQLINDDHRAWMREIDLVERDSLNLLRTNGESWTAAMHQFVRDVSRTSGRQSDRSRAEDRAQLDAILLAGVAAIDESTTRAFAAAGAIQRGYLNSLEELHAEISRAMQMTSAADDSGQLPECWSRCGSALNAMTVSVMDELEVARTGIALESEEVRSAIIRASIQCRDALTPNPRLGQAQRSR